MADLGRLVEEKNKQRAALKKEFYKQMTHPEASGQGHVFDPAMQRYLSMRVTRIDFFRETPKNFGLLVGMVIVPIAATVWFLQNGRDKREALLRSGAVAYKDRMFKFV